MRVRQLLGVATAALLASVAVPAALAPDASAATPGYVGIVITGSGEHSGYCVRWHSGITGDEILNDVAAVRYRGDGLILTINGQPTIAKADGTHYWSYWEVAGATWQYSTFGASGTQPGAGSVDGWSYDDGSSSAPSPQAAFPAGQLYATLCGHLDVPPPASTATHSAVPASQPVAPRTSAAVAGTSTARTRSARSSARPTSSATRSFSDAPDQVYVPAPSGGDTAVSMSPAAARHRIGSGSAWPTVGALAIVAALLGGAGAAAWSRRRPA